MRRRSRLTTKPFNVPNPVGRKRTHTLVAKSRVCSSWGCGLSSVVYHGWEGKMVVNLVGDLPLCPIVNSTVYVFILHQ